MYNEAETVGPPPSSGDGAGAALQAYWEAVEALGSLMARMRDESTRSVLVVMGGKAHSPKEFEARMRSMVSERDDLYRRLYEGDSLFNPERLPKTNAQGAVGFPDGLCSLVIHDDQPLYAETKPSEWVPYQFAQALLETKPVVEKDAAGADPDAEVVPTTASTFAWKPAEHLWSKTSRIRGGEGKFQLRPNPEYFTKVLEDGIPGNVILFDLKGKHSHSGSVLGLANNMDAFRGAYCVGTTDAEVGVPFYATIDLVAPSGRSTAGHGGRARERRSQKNTGTARRCRTPAWGRKGPASTLRPYRSRKGKPASN